MELKEECGLFGVWGHPDAAELARLGLFALQHRGQENAGIVTSSEGTLLCQKGNGLVTEVFPEPPVSILPGDRAIGHVRYSTTGTSRPINAQPFVVNYSRGSMAIAHNGNLTNAGDLRAQMEATWSSPSRTPAISPPWATQRRPASPTSSASSGITMWAEPLMNP